MFSSSARRVATVASHMHTPIIPSFPAGSTVGLCVARRNLSSQPRYASSKASSSDNDPKNIAATDDSVSLPVERSSKSSGEKRKRKTKAEKSASKGLPTVPTTNHISQQGLALTSFFALHRPISVTDSIPQTVSNDTFASIFTPKQPSVTPSEVISTLSETVDQLEEQGQAPTTVKISASKGGLSAESEVKQYTERAVPSLLKQLNSMTGKFMPFSSPPTPAGEGEGEPTTMAAEEASPEMEEDLGQGNRVQYKAVITIDQITNVNGSVKMVAHTPEIFIEPPASAPTHGRRGRHIQLISVRRIRKLKMKKKKYKKLMRKTRNERRKLDKL